MEDMTNYQWTDQAGWSVRSVFMHCLLVRLKVHFDAASLHESQRPFQTNFIQIKQCIYWCLFKTLNIIGLGFRTLVNVYPLETMSNCHNIFLWIYQEIRNNRQQTSELSIRAAPELRCRCSSMEMWYGRASWASLWECQQQSFVKPWHALQTREEFKTESNQYWAYVTDSAISRQCSHQGPPPPSLLFHPSPLQQAACINSCRLGL